MATKWIKAFAWWICGAITRLARGVAILLGRRRRVDVLIYKVDRLGDWFLAEPAITAIVNSTLAQGGTVAIWASRETAALRAWRGPGCAVESFVFEPRGLYAKLRRALSVVHLLAVYQARTLICLRHSPEPVRDFILAQADAVDIHALSWRIFPGAPGQVPHEIARHFAILAASGQAPAKTSDLLPALARPYHRASDCVVITPFSSAQIKDWSDSAWCEVVNALANRGLRFELWVGPDQIERAKALACLMKDLSCKPDVAVKSGKLAELAEAVGAAGLVLTVDTFATHLAVASDVPTVCLIGGGQFGDFGPWQRSPRQQWISQPLPCFGCNWVCTRSQADCLQDITPARIMNAIEAVWPAKAKDLPMPSETSPRRLGNS